MRDRDKDRDKDKDEISVSILTDGRCDTLSHEQHGCSTANVSADATEGAQVIEVIAKKYEFNPSPIRVKQGTRVRLGITATDHAHGFAIRQSPDGADAKANAGLVFSSPQECQKIEKGQTATVEFVAQTPGTYSFRCCTHCGWNHKSNEGPANRRTVTNHARSRFDEPALPGKKHP